MTWAILVPLGLRGLWESREARHEDFAGHAKLDDDGPLYMAIAGGLKSLPEFKRPAAGAKGRADGVKGLPHADDGPAERGGALGQGDHCDSASRPEQDADAPQDRRVLLGRDQVEDIGDEDSIEALRGERWGAQIPLDAGGARAAMAQPRHDAGEVEREGPAFGRDGFLERGVIAAGTGASVEQAQAVSQLEQLAGPELGFPLEVGGQVV